MGRTAPWANYTAGLTFNTRRGSGPAPAAVGRLSHPDGA